MQHRKYDNFISENDLVKIEQNVLQASIFKAYESTAYDTSDNVYDVMMNRVFFCSNYGIIKKPEYDEKYLPYFYPILNNLPDIGVLQRVSLNLTFATPLSEVSKYHIDSDLKNSYTCIFYLNSNNGGTKFKESGEFVQSQRNRLVRFPSLLEHTAINTTNTKFRWVLNINYIGQY
tara:strand:- start:47 stop:571 length:525 start_codon:yes stop_codon:yes gene_type:complete